MGLLTPVLLFVVLLSNSPLPGFGKQLFNEPIKLEGMLLKPNGKDNAVPIFISSLGKQALQGYLGSGLPEAVQLAGLCSDEDAHYCFEYGDYAKLLLTVAYPINGHCYKVEWRSNLARRLEDCFDLNSTHHWYGGGGPTFVHTWPIEQVSREEAPLVPGDAMAGFAFGGVSENYWVLSSGVTIHVDEDVPLWFSLNSTNKPGQACFVAKDSDPYGTRQELVLKYEICTSAARNETFKDIHLRNLNKYYKRPSTIPDTRMLIDPIWSTWAQWHRNVNQTLVLELANRLIEEGFDKNSHIEIDDMWEAWYGDAEFNLQKFPDPKAMIDTLHDLGFRATTWVIPFINIESPSFQTAFDKGYFVKDQKDKFGMTQWWQGENSGLIDFTNEEGVAWWTGRLETLQSKYGLDGFKFDAGEYNWLPTNYKLSKSDGIFDPSIATTKYVAAVAKFGGLSEVRVGRLNQNEAIFTRMLDKDSVYGYNNGLKSLIPTLLDFGLKGYTFVLPDMIGGNAYGDRPNRDLYIRWLQANAFMPSIQFSILPWDYDPEVVTIVKGILNIRNEFAEKIIGAAEQSVIDGSPINRPMWWYDPLDVNTYTIDNQYMLGDDILVAPVVEEGATSRDIYLPTGTWSIRVGSNTETYEGPITLESYPAPLDFLPWFIRISN